MLAIEAVGERNGQAMDLDVAIHDGVGKLLQAFADTLPVKGAPAFLSARALDPSGAWTAPADGEYALMIRDLYGPTALGLDRTYALAIGPPRPEAWVVTLPAESNGPLGLAVEPGKTVTVDLVVIRRGGHNAPITVRARRSPAGLSAVPARIAQTAASSALTIAAGADAPAWSGRLTLEAVAEIDNTARPVRVRTATPIRDGKPIAVRLCDGLAAAVLRRAGAAPCPPGREKAAELLRPRSITRTRGKGHRPYKYFTRPNISSGSSRSQRSTNPRMMSPRPRLRCWQKVIPACSTPEAASRNRSSS